MQGATSNQIVKCIIFSMCKRKGIEKLKEIKREKLAQGIKVAHYVMGSHRAEIRFSDGEEWIVLHMNESIRGYRWRKAWVDNTIPQTSINDLIKPISHFYKWEDYKLF